LNWRLPDAQVAAFSRSRLEQLGLEKLSQGTTGAGESALASKIRAVKAATIFDDDAKADGERALAEAVSFVNHYIPRATPRIMISSDGVILLQWQTESDGVALVFPGDGCVVFSMKSSNHNYTDSGIEFGLNDSLPTILKSKIGSLNSSKA
jgi:hypothetical protein